MRYLTLTLLLLAVSVFSCLPALANENGKSFELFATPKVTRVEVIYDGPIPRTLNIYGRRFGNELPPIRVDGTRLTAISNTGELIIAEIPSTRLFEPGSYLLELIIVVEGTPNLVRFDVTFGTQGPQGETGPQGPPGPAGSANANIINAGTQYNISGNRILSTPGFLNTYVGRDAGNANGGQQNTFIGSRTGQANSTGVRNTFVGDAAGSANLTAQQNTFVGALAGLQNTTGQNNSFFGSATGGLNTTGERNTLIGFNTNVAVGNLTNATAIGAGAVVSFSNTVQLGRADGSDRVFTPGGIALNGNSIRLLSLTDNNHSIFYNSSINGIQFNAFDAFLWVNGRNNRVNMQLLTNGNLGIIGNYNQVSDARYKSNVQTFAGALDTLRRMRGVTFNWKPELGKSQSTQIGFIAQEVEAVLPELVSTDEKGYKSVTYSNVVPVLVEAVKEQQRQIEQQRLLIDGLMKIVCSNNQEAEICKEAK